MMRQNGREDRSRKYLEVAKKVFSPPDVAGRPDRSPGQAGGKRAQKTTVLIEVPVSGRLGYLTTFDA